MSKLYASIIFVWENGLCMINKLWFLYALVFVILSHLHKLRYNTFIWPFLTFVFLIIRHHHGLFFFSFAIVCVCACEWVCVFSFRLLLSFGSLLICNLLTRLVAGAATVKVVSIWKIIHLLHIHIVIIKRK